MRVNVDSVEIDLKGGSDIDNGRARVTGSRVHAGEEVSHGDEGGEDVGHHRRRFHHVLAALLHHVRGARVLPQLHPPDRLQRSILARILQFRDQPLHLRSLQQGLPLRLQEDYLQVLLQATRQHPATRQRRQPIGDEVSVFCRHSLGLVRSRNARNSCTRTFSLGNGGSSRILENEVHDLPDLHETIS